MLSSAGKHDIVMAVVNFIYTVMISFLEARGGSRKKYLGAWPLIIWEATTAKRNYYRTNYINQYQKLLWPKLP